jgi:hypothetical protein
MDVPGANSESYFIYQLVDNFSFKETVAGSSPAED